MQIPRSQSLFAHASSLLLARRTVDLSKFNIHRALPKLHTYGGLTSDELDKRIETAFHTTFAYGKAMTCIAIALPHVRDLEWLCRDYERYVATVIKYIAGNCARRIVLSLLEGRIIGRSEFALDPIPTGYQELVYCFLALMPVKPLPTPITATTRLNFERPALRIGASLNSSGNRATTSFQTSTQVENLFTGLPDHLHPLIPICAGALLAIPVDDIGLDPSLRRFAFTFERHLLALGHFYGDDPMDALVAFDTTRRYGTLTKRVGGAGPTQYGKEVPGPIKDIPAPERSERAEEAITDRAQYRLGGRLIGSLQQHVDLAAVYDVGYAVLRIIPDPLMNVALPVGSPAKAKQPARGWNIKVSSKLDLKLGKLFREIGFELARQLKFGVRQGGFVLTVPITETDALEIELLPDDIGQSGMRSLAEILYSASL
ncbi:hypothetical protein B0A53_03869 [Rhodotorula sp. CCFEE 5036]|nr:hypothetical protein B0A53_03869 [Rhodotorula sp. CCFEE 5036]